MSRFSPPDHLDCIIASESITVPGCSANSSELSTSQQSSLFQPVRNVYVCMSAQHRKYLSLALLLVLLSLFCLISTSIIDVLNDTTNLKYSKDKETALGQASSHQQSNHVAKIGRIQLENILQNELAAEYFNGSWISFEEIAFYDTEYNLCLYNSTSRTVRHLIQFPLVLSKSLKSLQLSNDMKYLLTPLDTIELFRYSKLEKLKIYDIKNNSYVDLFADPNFANVYFQFGQWGPKSNQIVFVYNNDIYYKDSVHAETVRLTVTGLPGIIYNGLTDWLYEEEILNSDKALWFSPFGTDLAYLQINSSLVDVQSWNRYGEYYNISSNQYPAMESIRYPKPGTNNPKVSIFIADLHRNVEHIRIKQISPPAQMANMDHYITKVAWYNNDQILIAWTSRNQTQSLLVICDRLIDWSCQELYQLSASHGWVDGFENGLISAYNQDSVVVRVPKWVSSGKSDYYHIASINVKSKTVTFLTDGKYDVVKLIAYSAITNEVFYSSTLANHPEVQHIMKIGLIKDKTEPVCMTCYLGNSCRYNEAHFNNLASRYVLECNGYEIPRVELRNAHDNELIEILEQNARLFQFLKDKSIPRYEKIFVKLADNEDAIVELILPPTFDEDNRYPLVIELYGAPNTQMVKDKYEMNHWSSYLTTEKEFIYARVDVRGSSNQGLRYMHQLYKNLGHLEVDDLIDVVWFLKSNLTYIDTNRIAVWGWSYGGYMSLMSLIREFDNKLFSCAIAVAPVSNWMYYDSAYSERYLGIPDKQNLYAYEDSNLLDSALLLKNKKFLMIFGTSDDNVHMQHSLLLIRKLNELNIDYDVQIYPDDNHYLLKSSAHLYRKMSNYIHHQCFYPK